MRRWLLLAASLLVAGTAAFADKREDYLRWMQEALPECPQFDAWQKESGTLPPDFEALPRLREMKNSLLSRWAIL